MCIIDSFCLDVSYEKKVKMMFSYIRKKYGSLDILINNAGIASMNHALLTNLEIVHKILNTNIVGTFNLLEACVKNNVRRIVFSSSSSVYGNAVYPSMDENHPLKYRDFYAATKLAGESLLRAFYIKHGLEYIILRFMNIYGPRQDYQGAYVAIILKIIDRIQQNLAPLIQNTNLIKVEQVIDFLSQILQLNTITFRGVDDSKLYSEHASSIVYIKTDVGRYRNGCRTGRGTGSIPLSLIHI